MNKEIYYCKKCGAESSEQSKTCIRKDCDGDLMTAVRDRPQQ